MPVTDSQLPDLMRMIAGTAEAVGGQLTPTAAAVIAGDLRAYDLNAIGLALADIRRTARGRFSVGDILRVLSQRDGRPQADEAWSIALSASDESATVVLTSEIQMALAAAQPVIDAGDKIGGRRTFIVAYERLVEEARAAAKPCAWQVSLGTDPAQRSAAIEGAARLGRITQEAASHHLALIGSDSTTADGQAIAGLITGNAPRGKVSQNVRENLAKIRASLTAGMEERKAKEREHRKQVNAELNARADKFFGIGDGVMPDHDAEERYL